MTNGVTNPVGVLQLKVNLPIAVLLFLVGGLFIFLYWWLESYRVILTFGAAVFAGMAAIYSAFFVGKNLKLNLERDMLHRSFEITGRIVSAEFNEAYGFVIGNLDHRATPSTEIYNKIHTNPELMQAVRIALNNFDDVAIAIQKGYADEDTIYMALRHLLPLFYETLRPFIEQMRKERGDSSILIEFEKLARTWNAGKYLYSGLPIRNTNS